MFDKKTFTDNLKADYELVSYGLLHNELQSATLLNLVTGEIVDLCLNNMKYYLKNY